MSLCIYIASIFGLLTRFLFRTGRLRSWDDQVPAAVISEAVSVEEPFQAVVSSDEEAGEAG